MSDIDKLIEWMGANQYFIGNDLLAKVREIKVQDKVISFSKVVESVTKYTGITKEQLLRRGKSGDVPFARHLVYYFGNREAGKSLVYIANYIGHKDHTSGVAGIKNILGFIDTKDEKTLTAIREINVLLKGEINS